MIRLPPFLEMADLQNVIAYTDTVTASNVSLYEHFGFQCVEASPVLRNSNLNLCVAKIRQLNCKRFAPGPWHPEFNIMLKQKRRP